MSQDKLLEKQLRTMISKSRRSLAAARRQVEDGDYDFASSRAYYAAFYAIEAVLLTKNLVLSKHSGVAPLTDISSNPPFSLRSSAN